MEEENFKSSRNFGINPEPDEAEKTPIYLLLNKQQRIDMRIAHRTNYTCLDMRV